MVSGDGHISLSMVFSRAIHVVARICSLFLLIINKKYPIVQIQHILFIQSSADEPFDCFHSFADMGNAAEHLSTCFCVDICFPILLGICPGRELLGHTDSTFNFLRNCQIIFRGYFGQCFDYILDLKKNRILSRPREPRNSSDSVNFIPNHN